MDEQAVLARISGGERHEQRGGRRPAAAARPDPRDPRLIVEREVLKLAVQRPALAGPVFDGLDVTCFTAPAYVAVREAITSAGGTATVAAGAEWVGKVASAAETD